MGVFSLFKKRSLNEKVIDKIYNKIFVKEYIISDLKINEKYIESLLICNYGIYLIKIIATKNQIKLLDDNYVFDDQKINLQDIENNLNENIFLIQNIIGNFDIHKKVIIKCYNQDDFNDNSIDEFILKLEKNKKILSNENIEDIYKKLVLFKTYK